MKLPELPMRLGMERYRCWSDMRQHLCSRCGACVVTTLHGQFWLACGNDQVTFDEVAGLFSAYVCFEGVLFMRHDHQRCTTVRILLKQIAREGAQ